ncbi:MAG TPA: hypothetical protein VKD24_09400 [Candidatus Angelobacter sp.]|jgi:hypothetical protein|nr:hypothetical protein [Candidatus Angelobacter sp.]
MPVSVRIVVFALALASLSSSSESQQSRPTGTPQANASPAPALEVPVIDGGAGPCSLALTVTDGQAKGVYGVTVKVHIAYGFAGVRKLDLEAGTNSDGKVTFKGLPAKVRNPPLEFHATKNQLTGLASFNPATECQAKHDIILEKLAAPAASSR